MGLWIIFKGTANEKLSPIRLPLFLFTSLLCVSIVFSGDKLKSLEEFYKYAAALLLFLIVISLAQKDKLILIRTMLFSGLIISLLAIYQYFFGIRHTLDYMLKNNITTAFAMDFLQAKRIFFPFVTPNILGGYLGMLLPLSFIYKDKYFFILPLATAILLTKSIGALFSILAGIIVYLCLQKKLDKKRIIFLLLLSMAIGLIFFLRCANTKEHLQPLFSLSARMNYWKDALRIIIQYPLSGLGIGNFNLIESRYAHNSYLQLCAEIGILGLICFIWLIAKIIMAGFKNEAVYKTAVFAAILIFLIHNLFDFSFFLPEVSLIWWVALSVFL